MLPCGRGLRTPTYPTHLCVLFNCASNAHERSAARSAAPPPRAPRPAETPRSAPVTMAARASRSTGATAREPPQIAPSQINGPPLLPPTGSQQSAERRARLRPGLTPIDKVKVLPARNGLRACDYSLGGSCSTRPVLILRASGCARRARCAGRRSSPPRRRCLRRKRQRARPSGGWPQWQAAPGQSRRRSHGIDGAAVNSEDRARRRFDVAVCHQEPCAWRRPHRGPDSCLAVCRHEIRAHNRRAPGSLFVRRLEAHPRLVHRW